MTQLPISSNSMFNLTHSFSNFTETYQITGNETHMSYGFGRGNFNMNCYNQHQPHNTQSQPGASASTRNSKRLCKVSENTNSTSGLRNGPSTSSSSVSNTGIRKSKRKCKKSENLNSNIVLRNVPGISCFSTSGPFIRIIEQPHKDQIFRYLKETTGRSRLKPQGQVLGEHSSEKKKSYTKVQLCNYRPHSTDKIIMRLTLCSEQEYEGKRILHVHELFNKDTGEGLCPIDIEISGPDYVAEFKNMVIIFTGIKKQVEILSVRKERHEASALINPSMNSLSPERVNELKTKAEIEVNNFFQDKALKQNSLNTACLKFEALLAINGRYVEIPGCEPVCSTIMINKKNVDFCDLVVINTSHVMGTCRGNDQVLLLVDKVREGNIKVKFFQPPDWSVFITPAKVHKNCGLLFKTPAYKCTDIRSDVQVYFQLYRDSDGSESRPMVWTYTPHHHLYEQAQALLSQQWPSNSSQEPPPSNLQLQTPPLQDSASASPQIHNPPSGNLQLQSHPPTQYSEMQRSHSENLHSQLGSQWEPMETNFIVEPLDSDQVDQLCNQVYDECFALDGPSETQPPHQKPVSSAAVSQTNQRPETKNFSLINVQGIHFGNCTSISNATNSHSLPPSKKSSTECKETKTSTETGLQDQFSNLTLEQSSDTACENNGLEVPNASRTAQDKISNLETKNIWGFENSNKKERTTGNFKKLWSRAKRLVQSGTLGFLRVNTNSRVISSESYSKEVETTQPFTPVSARDCENSLLTETTMKRESTENGIHLDEIESQKVPNPNNNRTYYDDQVKNTVQKMFFDVGNDKDSLFHILIKEESDAKTQMFVQLSKQYGLSEALNQKNSNGEAPLHAAVREGKLQMVNTLLDGGADVDVKNEEQLTSLQLAVASKHENALAITQALLAKGAVLTVVDNLGSSVLHTAVTEQRLDLILALLTTPKNQRQTCTDLIHMQDRQGNTALHIAVSRRLSDVIQLLLQYVEGSNLEVENHEGMSPLDLVNDCDDTEGRKIKVSLLFFKRMLEAAEGEAEESDSDDNEESDSDNSDNSKKESDSENSENEDKSD